MSNPHPINFLNALGAPAFVTTDAASILETMKAYFEEETGRTLSPSQTEMYLLETAAYMMGVFTAENQHDRGHMDPGQGPGTQVSRTGVEYV